MSRVAGVGDRGVCVTRQKLYHVEQFGGVWWIRGDGDVILEIHKEKWAAMGAAYRLALRQGPGRVIIHNHDSSANSGNTELL